jgi:hypothetical protein
MTSRLPNRALIPVLVLAVLGGVIATFIVARPPSGGSEDMSLIRPKLGPKAKSAAKKKKTPVAKAPVKKPVVKPAVKPVPVPVAPVRPKVEPVKEDGLPRVLTTALAAHSVVVVSLYDPESALDEIALAEARAGARAAGVGFVALNVFSETQSRPLVQLLGTLENPSVLVYRRPEALFARLGGFADSETVAQAAANAAR